MSGVEELLAAVADRPGWSENGPAARYAPTPEGWSCVVRRVAAPVKRYQTLHLSVLDSLGRVTYTYSAGTSPRAIQLAEHYVGRLNAA